MQMTAADVPSPLGSVVEVVMVQIPNPNRPPPMTVLQEQMTTRRRPCDQSALERDQRRL